MQWVEHTNAALRHTAAENNAALREVIRPAEEFEDWGDWPDGGDIIPGAAEELPAEEAQVEEPWIGLDPEDESWEDFAL